MSLRCMELLLGTGNRARTDFRIVAQADVSGDLMTPVVQTQV